MRVRKRYAAMLAIAALIVGHNLLQCPRRKYLFQMTDKIERSRQRHTG